MALLLARSPLLLAVCLGVLACSGSAPSPADSKQSEPPGTTVTPDAGVSPGVADGAVSPPVSKQGWGAQSCPAPGAKVGFAVGDSIGNLGVKDCDTGAEVTIDEVCGAEATWIFAAHTHCPTCQATAGFTDEVAAAVAAKNVAVVHLVYDDNGTSCAAWRAAYKLGGLDNVRVYADPGGAAYGKLKTTSYTAPSAFLDANRVITYKEHGLAKSAVLTQIDAALANP